MVSDATPSGVQAAVKLTERDLRASTPARAGVIAERPARELPRSRWAAGAAGRALAQWQGVVEAGRRLVAGAAAAGVAALAPWPAWALAWASAAGSVAG